MTLSMTGCGEGVAVDGPSSCRVEVRCVNNRSFKFSLRARDGASALESRAEALVRDRVRRGTVQMTLELTGPVALAGRRLDSGQLARYFHDLSEFCAAASLPPPRGVESLLTLPGVLVETPADAAAVDRAWPLVERALAAALDRLDGMRASEGATLARELRGICGEIAALVATIRERVPLVLEAHRTRLVDRVGTLLEQQGTTLSEADIAHEVTLIADRSDIAEELARLTSHLAQFDALLAGETPGRALDFLTQELGREANTIGSKSLDVETAHAVVAIKTRIERLREQVQNIE